MSTHYRHTQFGRVWMVVMGFVLLVIVMVLLELPPGPPRSVVAAFILFPIVLGVLFTSVTTIVTEAEFVHYFGPGFWRKRIALSDIVSFAQVRNKWWYGFGIRYTPHGWLYNVWGLEAVECRLQSGRTFRVGTDEPRELIEALERARGPSTTA